MDVVAALVTALPAARQLGGDGIADALWLAAAASPPDREPTSVTESSRTPSTRTGAPSPTSTDKVSHVADGYQEPVLAGRATKEDVPVPIHRIPVATTRYRAAPAKLNLAWALRPFKRRWPRGSVQGLDVEATVRNFAYTRQLLPALSAAPERWFDLHVVIDTQLSMRPWLPEVASFAGLLSQLGVFRTAHQWRLEDRDGAWVLLDRQGRLVRPGRLRSPQSRSLVAVVSTFAAEDWAAQPPWDMIRGWAESTPTVLVNVLPTRLWRYSALEFPAVRVTAAYPGVTNRGLVTRAGHDDAQLLLPVVSLSSSSIARWAAALMQADPRGCHALRAPANAAVLEARDALPGPALASSFLVTASSNAIRLAALCSVLPRIPVELFDRLRTELMPELGTDDVAEFLLSGLLDLHPDNQGRPEYVFRPGVPGILSTRLPVTDAWRLYSHLISQVAASGAPHLVEAVLYDVNSDADLPAAARPYALASRNVLRALGWAPTANQQQRGATVSPLEAAEPAAVDATVEPLPVPEAEDHASGLGVRPGRRTSAMPSDGIATLDPTISRRRVRNELVRARVAAGMTQREVAKAMDWAQPKLIRIESGLINISTHDLRALLHHYGADQSKITAMVDFAQSARNRTEWSIYHDVASPQYIDFCSYESSASAIRNFEPFIVPGLLQIEEYARTVIGTINTDSENTDTLVDLRMQRQELLTRADPPQMHFILDESVICRQVGGLPAMQRQLQHLLELSEHPSVTIRVTPFSQGLHPKIDTSYVHLEFPAQEDDDLLYIENPLLGDIIRDAAVIRDATATQAVELDPAAYLAAFSQLEQVTSVDGSRERIERQISIWSDQHLMPDTPAAHVTDSTDRTA